MFSVDGRPVSPSSTTSEADKMGQKFSVTTHPGLPIILFSDGFMVTVIQINADVTCVSLMRELILLSSKHMQRIMEQEDLDHSVVTAYHLPAHSGQSLFPMVQNYLKTDISYHIKLRFVLLFIIVQYHLKSDKPYLKII